MSSPTKPWEEANMASTKLQRTAMTNTYNTPVGRFRGAPTLPPRPVSRDMGYDNMNGMFNRGYGPMPYSSFSNYGTYGTNYRGYGGMGGMGGMYGNLGYGSESRFIELAEQSTRPAFQSIASLIQAFSSVSMMLDSTFYAMTSSFQAVLGVAENFGRLRTMFGQFWSSFALIRFINWAIKKVQVMLGLRQSSELRQELWNQAVNETAAHGKSSWPIYLFLGIIMSAPYLINKLIPPVDNKKDPKNWTSTGHAGEVKYEFVATNSRELTIRPGDMIMIAPKSLQNRMGLTNTGWVYAATKNRRGIIPLNYVQPVGIPVKPDIPIANTNAFITEDKNQVEIKKNN